MIRCCVENFFRIFFKFRYLKSYKSLKKKIDTYITHNNNITWRWIFYFSSVQTIGVLYIRGTYHDLSKFREREKEKKKKDYSYQVEELFSTIIHFMIIHLDVKINFFLMVFLLKHTHLYFCTQNKRSYIVLNIRIQVIYNLRLTLFTAL